MAQGFEFLERHQEVGFALADKGRIDLRCPPHMANHTATPLCHPVYFRFLGIQTGLKSDLGKHIAGQDCSLAPHSDKDEIRCVHCVTPLP
jgi:hypothetical protein